MFIEKQSEQGKSYLSVNNEENIYYIECQCKHPDHLMIASYYDDEFINTEGLHIQFQMPKYLPWYKRLAYGLRYIFNQTYNSDCHWVSTGMTYEKTLELNQFINQYLIKAIKSDK